MSDSYNHHYVSQVLIRKFLDHRGKICYYSKTGNYLHYRDLSRFDFAKRELNTIVNYNHIDRNSIEQDLSRNFENDFNTHYEIVKTSLSSRDYSKISTSVDFLLGMGIIGEMRTPLHQQNIKNTIANDLSQFLPYVNERVALQINAIISGDSNAGFKSTEFFSQIAALVKSQMGDITYSIFIAPDSEYFLLPDTSSLVFREQLEPNIISGEKTYYDPRRMISMVFLPLDSHTAIVGHSDKICPQQSHGIYNITSDVVLKYNKMLFERAHETVACENYNYLSSFVPYFQGNLQPRLH